MYEAFLRGDIAFLLAQMSPTVQWEEWRGNNTAQNAGVAYLLARTGPDGVGAFFQAVADTLRPLAFTVDAVIGEGDEIVARISAEWEVTATGTTFADDELHWWQFDASGKVTAFRHYVDTAKHVGANARTSDAMTA
jgi:ketosteroid isomerase-like protein